MTRTRPDVEPASQALRIGRTGAAPSGPVHLADRDWNTLCGSGRARYRFPGRDVSVYDEACPQCLALVSGRKRASRAG